MHRTETFYKSLLQTIRSPDFRDGEWELCERIGLPDNGSYMNVGCVVLGEGEPIAISIVVNLSEVRSQARATLPWADSCRPLMALDRIRCNRWSLSEPATK